MTSDPNLLIAYYQQMPPFAGGTALRGGSVMPAISRLWQARVGKDACAHVLTMVGEDPGSGPLRFEVLSDSLVTNQSGLLVRLVGELRMGLRAALRVISKQPSGVLLSSPGYWPCILIATACRVRRIPYFLDVRDLYPEVYLHSGLMGENSFIYHRLQSLTSWWYRNACAIAVATEGLRKVVQTQCRRADGTMPPVKVVYNGFPASLQEIRPTKHARFTVAFHGVLGYFQDIETLCALAQRLQAHEIDVVAVGYGRKEDQLQNTTSANLRYLGRLSHSVTMRTVAQCHVGLCLRRDDGISKDAFPVKVWEYLGLGMPSIVTPACEAGEFLVQHGCGIQLNAGDLDALEATIVQLRDKPERLADMARRCYLAAQAYTREAMGEELAELVLRNLGGLPK